MLKPIYQWTSLQKKVHTFLPRCQALVWKRRPAGPSREAPSAASGPGPQPRWV